MNFIGYDMGTVDDLRPKNIQPELIGLNIFLNEET